MPGKVVVSGVVFVILTALLVFIVEFFIPISAKSDMNIDCRGTLLKMETAGGLTSQEKNNLNSKLTSKGFFNIVITGTGSAKQGEEINLHVEADYRYSKLSGIFRRTEVIQHMVYNKTSMARRVVN